MDGAEVKDEILVLVDPINGKFFYYKITDTLISFYADEPKGFKALRLEIQNQHSLVKVELHKMFAEAISF